ncbi:MAG: acetate/propionate family kinase [Paracoccaceae bacterium]
MPKILVVNAGSSSIKFSVFDGSLTELFSGQIDIVTEGSARTEGQEAKRPPRHAESVPPTRRGGSGAARLNRRALDHAAGLFLAIDILNQNGFPLSSLSAAAHRVVHGGTDLSIPVRITPETLTKIQTCTPLAPLHNPHNIRAIKAIANLAPDLTQYASFDTGFHATNPAVATRYAVPKDWDKSNIRRFGFHGISYQALTAAYPVISGTPLPEKLLAFHLGNGASICAIHNGRSVATTMGYSPLEGLTMGTRAGSIDAGAVLNMARASSLDQVLETLNQRSGLYALSGGISDMETLLKTDTPKARFAVEHFCYWSARHAGSMIAAMGGVDTIAFTGGIGENAASIRDRILTLLNWTNVPASSVWVIPAQEERQIAQNALTLMATS